VRQRSGPAGAPIRPIENNLSVASRSRPRRIGYCSESNLEALEAHGIDGYSHPDAPSTRQPRTEKFGGPLSPRDAKEDRRRGFETAHDAKSK